VGQDFLYINIIKLYYYFRIIYINIFSNHHALLLDIKQKRLRKEIGIPTTNRLVPIDRKTTKGKWRKSLIGPIQQQDCGSGDGCDERCELVSVVV
jgi:hypothetical protein